jgi:hypothetical protein
MPGLSPACAHVRQSQKWDELFLSILFRDEIWHPPTTIRLALYSVHHVDAILQMTTSWNKVLWCAPKTRQGILQQWYTAS